MPNIFELLFYSEEIWGYLGVVGILTLSLIFALRVKYSFSFWCIACMLMGLHYFTIVTATGYYMLHAILLFFGAVISVFVGVEKLRE